MPPIFSKTLEFKRDLSSPDGALRAIVAFANTSGGTLLVGVEDRTRHVRGVADPLSTEERLANLLSDNVLPRLVPELEVLPWRSYGASPPGKATTKSRYRTSTLKPLTSELLQSCSRQSGSSRRLTWTRYAS